jgi:hypothetical protein
MKIKKDSLVMHRNGRGLRILDEVPTEQGQKFTIAETHEGADRKGSGEIIDISDIVGVVEFVQHADPALQAILEGEPKTENRLLVVRPESNVVALVSFRSVALMTGGQALVAIREAVTRWVMQTFEGTKAWDQSVEDFNVGDLIGYLSDPYLCVFLRTFGIYDLKIESLELSYERKDWSYDTLLVNDSEELKSLLKRSEDRIPATKLTDPDAETEEEIANLSWDSGRKDDHASEE